MRGAWLASSILLAVLFLAFAPETRALADETVRAFEKTREVRSVQIEGNHAFSDRKLRGLLRTRGGSFWKPWRHSPYRADFLRFDRIALQSYYRRRGYLNAQVDSVRTDPVRGSANKVDVTFFLTEGPLSRVSRMFLENTAPLPEAEVRHALKQKPGDPVDITRVEADRQAIEDHYANLGYAAVDVRDSLGADSTLVAVVYKIDSGPVVRMRRVSVEGLRTTRGRIVTRELTVHPGDVLSRKKLAESQQRIYDTGLYSDVVFERGDIDSVSHQADLMLTVRERRMAWIDAGLGYGTLDQLRFTTEWGQRNIGHEGIRFAVGGRMGVVVVNRPVKKWTFGDRRVDASLSQPWTLGARIQTSLGGYTEQVVQTQTGDKRFLVIPLRAYGAALAFRRDLSLVTHSTLSFEHRHVLSDSTSNPTLVGVEQKSYTTRRVGLALERDTRVDPFDPKAGSDLIGNMVVAGGVLKGSARFTKLSLGASTYIPFPRFTLALRVQSGYAKPFGAFPAAGDTVAQILRIPLEDRFFTGGASSVRGFFENEIGYRRVRPDSTTLVGGEVLLLGSIEARFPLFWVLGGAVFVDAGNVWERTQDVTFRRIFTVTGPNAGYSDMRYSAGCGIRIRTPVGPVRFDYGWKLRHSKESERDLSPKRGAFHFSLGQAF
jgi:outer membrane protein assembly complex protein YaeT